NLMAKALYDNVPESPEELAFRKGDILSVIEQNTGGLEGWWLCSLHGRQGIAPGNRLKLLIGPLFEAQANPPAATGSAHSPTAHQQKGAGLYQVPPSPATAGQEVYQVPQRSAMLAPPDAMPNKWLRGRALSWTEPPGQGQRGRERPRQLHKQLAPGTAEGAPEWHRHGGDGGGSHCSLSVFMDCVTRGVEAFRRNQVIAHLRAPALRDLSAAPRPMSCRQLKCLPGGDYRRCRRPSMLGMGLAWFRQPPGGGLFYYYGVSHCEGLLLSNPVGQSYTFSPGQPQDLYDVPPCRAQGVYDVPPGKAPGSSPFGGKQQNAGEGVYDIPPSQADPRTQGVYDIPPSQADPRTQGVYDIPPAVYSVPPCRAGPASLQEGTYDFPPPLRQIQEGTYDFPPPLRQTQEGTYDFPRPSDRPEGTYDFPPPLRQTQEGTYDFPPPLRQTQEGVYDVPPPILSKPGPAHATESPYDFPPPASEPPGRLRYPDDNEGIYDVPPPTNHTNVSAVRQGDLYDIPRGVQTFPQHRTPPTAAVPPSRGVYDVPPTQDSPRGGGGVADVTDGVNRLSFSSTGSTRSSMSTSSSSGGSAGSSAPLDPDAAIQRLSRLQGAVENSVAAVQALAASPHWRTLAFMERHSEDVRALLDRVRAALGDILLRRQLGRLEDSQQILLQTYRALEACGWASDELDRFVMVARTLPDDVKQLASAISCHAELLFRRGAGDGSFSRGSTPEEGHPPAYPSHPDEDNDNYRVKAFPVPSGQDKDNMNNSEKCVKSWMEDYDYVHLQGKEDFERQQKELLDKENIIKQNKVQLGQEQINQFRKLEQEVAKPVENDITQWMSRQRCSPSDSPSTTSSPPCSSTSITSTSSSTTTTTSSSSSSTAAVRVSAHDRQLLLFYAQQCEQHFAALLGAVDAFFACVGAGQPPRIFVAHGKFVILSAHKLVFIGDALSRQAGAPDVADRVTDASNVLCDLLKTVVGSTKAAALGYPSAGAVQGMVDRVTELSHHARRFKEQLLHMATAL
ncbi:hypothetical protein NHX12_023979, partial [Muraenolepis orangiensis]